MFDHNVLDLVFEATSALGTTGLTTGITPYLSRAGRVIIIACMFIGRLSPVTVIVALRHRRNRQLIHYPKESVMIG